MRSEKDGIGLLAKLELFIIDLLIRIQIMGLYASMFYNNE